jgi:hypothetical protein
MDATECPVDTLSRCEFTQAGPSPPVSFIAKSRISDILRSHALCEPNWRLPFHALNSAYESNSAKMTAQDGGNAPPAMNMVFPGTMTKDTCVFQHARASMRINSEFVSNEIDESNVQCEKHDEERI